MVACIQLSSTTAALLGAIIGGVIGIVGTLITTWAAFEKETKAFRRASSQKHIDDVISAYQTLLRIIFTMKRELGIAEDAYNGVFAEISLVGSDEVKSILNDIIKLPHNQRKTIDTDKAIAAMQKHIKSLQGNLK